MTNHEERDMNTIDNHKHAPGPKKPSHRTFLPDRRPGHPLWQWVLAVVFRIAVVPVATFVLITGVGFCQEVTKTGSYGEFSLMGFNRTDHAIANFYVEGDWGGNIAPGGGGGSATCCTSLSRNKKTLHVKWILDWKSMADADRNLPMETYEADVPLPPIPKGDQSGYLQIYFFPGNRISAAYDALPGESDIKPQVTGRRIADTLFND
jgi:hypothetical protein